MLLIVDNKHCFTYGGELSLNCIKTVYSRKIHVQVCSRVRSRVKDVYDHNSQE